MNVIKQRSYIIIDEVNVWVQNDELTDSIYYDGRFIGTAIAKQVEFDAVNDRSYRDKELVYHRQTFVDGAWQDTTVGTFIVTAIEPNDTTGEVRVTALDYMLKFHIDYVPAVAFPCTLQEVYNDLLTQTGVEAETVSLDINADFEVTGNQFEGLLCLDVLKAIAEITGNYARMTGSDKLLLAFHSETVKGTINASEYSSLIDKRDSTPITLVTLENSAITGEVWTVRWEEGIEEYGENEYLISDNGFAFTQDRREALAPAILDKIKGWAYAGFEAKDCYLQDLDCGDLVNIVDLDGTTTQSIVLKRDFSQSKSILAAPSYVKTSINYWSKKDPLKRTEAIVDKATGDITFITSVISDVQSQVGNTYTKEEVNTLIANAESGLTNTFTKTGGMNLLRNTAPFFGSGTEWEYWEGAISRMVEPNALSGFALLLQNGTVTQTVTLSPNNYSMGFKYKRLLPTATATVKYNGRILELEDRGTIQTTGAVNVGSLTVEIECGLDNGYEIYDLMLNAGPVNAEWTQNANETVSDTVNISKGIEVTSSSTNTVARMDSDGFRVTTRSGKEILKATDTGTETADIQADGGTIAGLLIRKVEQEVWLSGV